MQAEPTKAEPPKRKRRWFQFSLRTLMIVVSLLAVPLGYVGWQAKIVRERRCALSAITESGGHIWTREGYCSSTEPGAGRMPPDEWPSEVPWLRRLLGDEHVASIQLAWDVSVAERIRIEALFPEATVFWADRLPEN